MITSESSNRDFHRFFDEHRDDLNKRLLGFLMLQRDGSFVITREPSLF